MILTGHYVRERFLREGMDLEKKNFTMVHKVSRNQKSSHSTFSAADCTWLYWCPSTLGSHTVKIYGHRMCQYWAHGCSPLTLLTKWNRKFPLWKELMFPRADMFPIQLVLMKLVLSGYWSRKNRHKCLMVIEDILSRNGSDTQCVFLSGEKCLYQAGRNQWLGKQWIVWASNDALGLWGKAGGHWGANCKNTRGRIWNLTTTVGYQTNNNPYLHKFITAAY